MKRFRRFAAIFLVCGGFCFAALAAQEVKLLGIESGGYLGIRVRDVNLSDLGSLDLREEKGALVEAVEPDSAAAKAGVVEKDVLLSFGGIPILSARHLTSLAGFSNPGQTISLGGWRAGKEMVFSVRMGERRGGLETRPNRGFALPDFAPDGAFSWHDKGFQMMPRGKGTWDFMVAPKGQRLGISGTPLTAQLAEAMGFSAKEGVLITEVAAGTPAEKAGLKAGDVIVAVDGQKVDGVTRLRELLDKDSVSLEYFRKSQRLTVDINFEGENPESGEDRSRL